MNPYVAAIRPADHNPRAMVRLLPAGRLLAKALMAGCPAGVRASHRPSPEGLVLITTGSRQFSEQERQAATAGLQADVDRRFGAGKFTVEGFTRDALPELAPDSKVGALLAAANRS